MSKHHLSVADGDTRLLWCMVHNALWTARAIPFTVKCRALLTEAGLHFNCTLPLTVMYVVFPEFCGVLHILLSWGPWRARWTSVQQLPGRKGMRKERQETSHDIHCSWKGLGDSWARLFLHQTRVKKGIASNICWWDRLPPVIVPPPPPHHTPQLQTAPASQALLWAVTSWTTCSAVLAAF